MGRDMHNDEMRELLTHKDVLPIELIRNSKNMQLMLSNLIKWRGTGPNQSLLEKFFSWSRSPSNKMRYAEFVTLFRYIDSLTESAVDINVVDNTEPSFDINEVDHTDFTEYYCKKCGWHMSKTHKCPKCVDVAHLTEEELL